MHEALIRNWLFLLMPAPAFRRFSEAASHFDSAELHAGS